MNGQSCLIQGICCSVCIVYDEGGNVAGIIWLNCKCGREFPVCLFLISSNINEAYPLIYS
jgi:hypothetical protein